MSRLLRHDRWAARYWAQFSKTVDSVQSTPKPERPELAAYGPGTSALIDHYCDLWDLPHSGVVIELLDRWAWLDQMRATEQKHALLESAIQRVQVAPADRQGELVFLLAVLRPIRRVVARSLLSGVRAYAPTESGARDRRAREEIRRLRNLERDEVFAVVDLSTVEILMRYGFQVGEGRFFAWFKETLSWTVIGWFREHYATKGVWHPDPAAAGALQDFLAGFEDLAPPHLRLHARTPTWQREFEIEELTRIADEYAGHATVEDICQRALAGLAPAQREVVQAVFWESRSLAEIASRRGVASSTARNTFGQAKHALARDQVFYTGLVALGLVRGSSHRRWLAERFPDGRLPDGRRVVVIPPDAA